MNNTKEIVFIEVDKLVPHPDNPRKDIGDVTELADSIKVKGILQNLTVVPFEGVGDRYTVVIGHRRLAAAKQAGLKEVPCVIADMNEKEQVETMLLENMQRSDLTYYEQAEGFQLMFDFGETVQSVSEKTGFSQSTVRKRVKLLKLDKEKFKESVNRGATLDDYMKLDEIEDDELRNSVIEFIGTSDFNYKLNAAKRKENELKNKAAIIEKLNTFAKPLNDEINSDDLDYVRYIGYNSDSVDVPDDADEREYYYSISDNYIGLYVEDTGDDEYEVDLEEEKRKREFEERKQKLEEIQKNAYELRREFVRICTGLPKNTDLVFEISVYAGLYGSYLYNYKPILEQLVNNVDEYADTDGKDEIYNICKKTPERIALMIAWQKLDAQYITAHTYNCEYKPENKLIPLYDFLMRLGYEMSGEEILYVYGTHELFVKPEKEADK